MSSKGYNTARKTTTRYEFVSTGLKGTILKRIEFTPLKKRGYYNIGFGDVMQDGTVNDLVYSNNQDIVKVMSTVIETIRDFIKEKPNAKLVFTGSTDDRTAFYIMVLKRYYHRLSNEFIITCLINNEENEPGEIEFETDSELKYLAFFIKNKM